MLLTVNIKYRDNKFQDTKETVKQQNRCIGLWENVKIKKRV
jgi:hypothetical protein